MSVAGIDDKIHNALVTYSSEFTRSTEYQPKTHRTQPDKLAKISRTQNSTKHLHLRVFYDF